MAWYNEEHPFAVGFSDGKVLLAVRDPERATATIDACQSNISDLLWDPTGKQIFIIFAVESAC